MKTSHDSCPEGPGGMRTIREWFASYLADPQVVVLAVLLLTGAAVVLFLGNMIAPVIASLVIAYLLEGIVRPLESRRVPRVLAVILVFFPFMVFLLFLLLWALPLISQQVVQLFQEIPNMINKGQLELLRLPDRYPQFISEEQVRELVATIRSQLGLLGQHVLSISISSMRSLFMILIYIVLMPLMVFFFLKDKYKINRWLRGFLPADYSLASQVWHDVDRQIGNFIRGKAWEILIVWGAAYATFLLFKLDYALLLSVLVGLSVIVPYVGATVMILPVAFVAFFQWGVSPKFVYMCIAYTILQILDGNVLVPLLLSEVVNIHPVAIIVAILVFGGLWGFWGIFFAIPLATLVQSVINAWPRKPRGPMPEPPPEAR